MLWAGKTDHARANFPLNKFNRYHFFTMNGNGGAARIFLGGQNFYYPLWGCGPVGQMHGKKCGQMHPIDHPF